MFESHRVTNRSRDHSTAWAAENPTIVGDARASAFRLDWSVRRTQCAFLQIFHRNGGWALHAAYVTVAPEGCGHRVPKPVVPIRVCRNPPGGGAMDRELYSIEQARALLGGIAHNTL
jgi:hypothetical protein